MGPGEDPQCRRDGIAQFATETTDFIDLACDAIYRRHLLHA